MRSRGMSINNDAPETAPPTLGSRGRSASQSIEVSKKSYTPARLQRTGSTIEMIRSQKIVEEDDDNDCLNSLLIRSVLTVITGASADTALFPMMLRFAQRSFIEIKVVVTSDRRTFPVPVREALTQFQKLANGFTNITIEHLITPSTDLPALVEHCKTLTEEESHFDVIAIGYSYLTASSPDATNETDNDNDRNLSLSPPLSRNRSQTLQETLAPAVPDSAEFKRQLGLPESIASSTLPHPELGALGCAIEEGGLANYLMVLHEPQGLINTPRKFSMGNSSVDNSNAASLAGSLRGTSPDIVASPFGHEDSLRTPDISPTVDAPGVASTSTATASAVSTSVQSTAPPVQQQQPQRRAMFRIDETNDDVEPSDIEIDVDNDDGQQKQDGDVDDDDDEEDQVKAGGKDI